MQQSEVNYLKILRCYDKLENSKICAQKLQSSYLLLLTPSIKFTAMRPINLDALYIICFSTLSMTFYCLYLFNWYMVWL